MTWDYRAGPNPYRPKPGRFDHMDRLEIMLREYRERMWYLEDENKKLKEELMDCQQKCGAIGREEIDLGCKPTGDVEMTEIERLHAEIRLLRPLAPKVYQCMWCGEQHNIDDTKDTRENIATMIIQHNLNCKSNPLYAKAAALQEMLNRANKVLMKLSQLPGAQELLKNA